MKLLLTATLLPIALLTATMAATPTAPDDELKCRSTQRTEPHYIIDGAFVEIGDDPGATLRELDGGSGNIASLAIVCWDPVRRVLQRGTGENVVHITTKTFMTSLHDDLRGVIAAQDAFHVEHGRFADKLAELGVEPATPGIDISMRSSEAGWQATASGELLIISCHVHAGTVTPTAGGIAERDPACAMLPQFAR